MRCTILWAAAAAARLCGDGQLQSSGYCCAASCGDGCGPCDRGAGCCADAATSPWCVESADVACFVPPGEPEAQNVTFPPEVAPSAEAMRDFASYAGVVSAEPCAFELGREVSVTLTYGDNRVLTAQPHQRGDLDRFRDFASVARLCEEAVGASGVAPAILSVTDSVAYFLEWWHLAANRGGYARRFAYRSFVWFGALPPRLARTGAACRRSRYGEDQWRKREPASVHYAKVAGALAVLERDDVSSLLYVDMDALFDPAALRFVSLDAATAVSRAYATRSVVFAEGDAVRRWRVIGDIFFARNDAWAKRFLALWLSHRCGFKGPRNRLATPCVRGFISHLTDNKHQIHRNYAGLDDGARHRAALRASAMKMSLGAIGLDEKDPLADHARPAGAGCCVDGASRCAHWRGCR
ncbi:hypothetical protein JL722_71 [Aureococcus anophagefferens]|nr:hypothetical protein JL722_71 [Aureococcus anophagefferens]